MEKLLGIRNFLFAGRRNSRQGSTPLPHPSRPHTPRPAFPHRTSADPPEAQGSLSHTEAEGSLSHTEETESKPQTRFTPSASPLFRAQRLCLSSLALPVTPSLDPPFPTATLVVNPQSPFPRPPRGFSGRRVLAEQQPHVLCLVCAIESQQPLVLLTQIDVQNCRLG